MRKMGLHSLCCCWFLLIGGLAFGADDSETARLKVIAEGTLSNRQSFGFLTCHFTLAHGEADREEDAIRNGPTYGKVVADCIWIVKDNQVRWESIADLEDLRAKLTADAAEQVKQNETGTEKPGGVRITTSFRLPLGKLIWWGSEGISYAPDVSVANFIQPDQGGPRVITTPFDMVGMMGPNERTQPGRLIQKGFKDDQTFCEYLGMQAINGSNVVVVSHKYHQSDNKPCTTYWLDPKRSFLPIQMTREYDDPKIFSTKVVVTDVQECSGGRWFPMRSVKVWKPGAAQLEKRLDVFELRVTRLDVDTPPPDDMFAIEIPKGALVNDNVDPNSQIAMKENRGIGVKDLDALVEEMDKKAEERRTQSERKAAVSPDSFSYRRRLLVGGSVVMLIILTTVLFVRSRRRARQS